MINPPDHNSKIDYRLDEKMVFFLLAYFYLRLNIWHFYWNTVMGTVILDCEWIFFFIVLGEKSENLNKALKKFSCT